MDILLLSIATTRCGSSPMDRGFEDSANAPAPENPNAMKGRIRSDQGKSTRLVRAGGAADNPAWSISIDRGGIPTANAVTGVRSKATNPRTARKNAMQRMGGPKGRAD